ncbi:MAG: HAD-IIA family hydrolase, partial [Kineosporiaceae bacterium]
SGPGPGRGAAAPWRPRPAALPPAALLLDIDGVVVAGRRTLPGAGSAVAAARRAGVPVRFVTNNASRSPAEVASSLVAAGVTAAPPEVVTSAVVAIDLVRERVASRPGPGAGVIAVVGGSGLLDPAAAAGLAAAPAVDVRPGDAAALVQGFSPDLGWRDLAAAARHARAGTWWVATNLDPTLPTEDGPAPGNGSLVAAVRTAAGRGPDAVAGKPDPVMVRRALSPAARADPAGAVMVGDRLDTDVAAARAAGVTAALVLSGVHGVPDLLAATPGSRPHLLAAGLPGVLAEHPAVESAAPGVAACRGVRVTVSRAEEVVDVVLSGRAADTLEDELDAIRALCTATWSLADGLPEPARAGLLAAVAGHPAVASLGHGRPPARGPGG